MKIQPDENLLVVRWVFEDGHPASDDVGKRIENLIQYYLIEIGHDVSGWLSLYRNPADGIFWELDYPESESHGGGPPRLRAISSIEARQRYRFSDKPSGVI